MEHPPDRRLRRRGPALRRLAVPLAAGALVLAHAALALDGARRHSAVFDEVVYPTSGWSYLTTGDYRMNPEHPPLLKLWTAASWLGSAVPVVTAPGWAEGDQWTFGSSLLYGDPPRLDLLVRARGMIALLSAGLAAGVFLVARRLAGDRAGLFALALYALDPLAIAHAGLATTDLGGAALYFAAAIAASLAIVRGGFRPVALGGVLLGLALGAKFSNVALLALVAAVTVAAAARPGPRAVPWRATLGRGAAVLAVALGALALLYGPAGPGVYLSGLAILGYHDAVGHPSFALGSYATAGRWWFFPIAWGIKTPVPILLASIAGIGLALVRFRRAPLRHGVLLGAPALIGLGAMASSLNLGVRHLLPLTPFLAVAGGMALSEVSRRRAAGLVVALALVGWLAAATALVHPAELAYANELAGGPPLLWRQLSDSNVDWGQDLPALAREIGRHPLRRLYLGYFGTADPRAYALRYQSITSMGLIPRRREDGPDPGGREWIALSVTNLMDVYSKTHDAYAWLRDRPMTAFPGYSIALYDITGDAEAHRRLGEEAMRFGDPESAEAPLRRAAELAPDAAPVLVDLARVLAVGGRLEEALAVCARARAIVDDAATREVCATIEGAR